MDSKEQLCRLCLDQPTETIHLYSDKNGNELTNIGAILKRHFWFDFGPNDTDLLSKIICPICWSQVEQFDQFYNSIKVKHQHYYADSMHCSTNEDNTLVVRYYVKTVELPIFVAIKEEPIGISVTETHQVIAMPLNLEDFFSHDDKENFDDKINNKSDEETAVVMGLVNSEPHEQLPKTSGHTSPQAVEENQNNIKENNDLIRKYFRMKCDKCANHSFESFAQAESHYLDRHNVKKGYLYCSCCSQYKYTGLKSIMQHCKLHDDPNYGFTCDICQKRFSSKPNLRSHVKVHIKNRQSKKCMMRSKNANRHTENMEELDSMLKNIFIMECDICDKKFDCYADVVPHYKTIHNQRGYLPCCERRFYSLNLAIDHCKWHANPDLFKCQHCPKSFMDKMGLTYHSTNTHTPENERKFKCELCSRTFAVKQCFTDHMRVKHGKKNHKCHICGKNYTRTKLRIHIAIVHDKKCAKICDICGKELRTKQSYQKHYAVEHTNISHAVQCDMCKAWLVHKTSLLSHMKRHLKKNQPKEPTATCNICGRILTNKTYLHMHMKRVHCPTAYKCSMCDKTFKRETILKEHEAIHLGIHLYKCTFCPMTSRSNATLYKHRKKEHPTECAETRQRGTALIHCVSDLN